MPEEINAMILAGCFLIGAVIARIIQLSWPNYFNFNHFKLLGLYAAVCGIFFQGGIFLNKATAETSETKNQKTLGAQNESRACLEAGWLAIGMRWEHVQGDQALIHHRANPPGSSFRSRLMCLDTHNLRHEIYPPRCNQIDFKNCK